MDERSPITEEGVCVKTENQDSLLLICHYGIDNGLGIALRFTSS